MAIYSTLVVFSFSKCNDGTIIRNRHRDAVANARSRSLVVVTVTCTSRKGETLSFLDWLDRRK